MRSRARLSSRFAALTSVPTSGTAIRLSSMRSGATSRADSVIRRSGSTAAPTMIQAAATPPTRAAKVAPRVTRIIQS